MTAASEDIKKFGWSWENWEFLDLRDEIDRAVEKHTWEQTPLNPKMFKEAKLVILVEEVGEVATAMTYDRGSPKDLKKELLQVAAMAYSWYLSMEDA